VEIPSNLNPHYSSDFYGEVSGRPKASLTFWIYAPTSKKRSKEFLPSNGSLELFKSGSGGKA
jgi:hypothetical protein